MYKKIKTSVSVAFSVSALSCAILVLTLLIAKVQLSVILISGFLSLVLVYFFSLYFINFLIAFKIKPIYQILESKNISTKKLREQISSRGDLTENIRHDITEWADSKAQEISRLQELEKYRKEFLGNVSHELKTPIFNIQGYILTLIDGGIDDPNINMMYLERAESSINRMINIVKDLEEISKLESGELILNKEKFDIVALSHELVDSMEYEASKRGIDIKVKGSSPIWVFADKKRMSQVLVNLVSNSVKYGKDNGTTKISFIDMYDKILIEVEDNGIGLLDKDRKRIFERFYRVDKSRSREQGGTGLGLSIVKHIIEAHNETVTVRGALGEGTTFSFTISKYKQS